MRAPRSWLPWICVGAAAFAPAARAQSPAADPVAERLRALEDANRKQAEQLELLRKQVGDLSRPAEVVPAPVQAVEPTPVPNDGISRLDGGSPVPDYTEGLFAPFTPAPGYPDGVAKPKGRYPLNASFGPGFRLESDDERFQLQIHYESQIEGRVWSPGDQLPANSGFFLPRQRIFFNGHITKPIEYELSINRGVNNINILNAYLNFHFDDRLEFRIGRFFTPLSYDQYAVSNYWLITPERSLFTTNLNLNRQIGAMAWGYLLEKRLDYAIGAFNGSRNSFESRNNGMDVVGYLNARPFQESSTLKFARFLNVGTSAAYGRQDQSPVPATFRIGAGSPDANIPSIATVPFLTFNSDVVERGDRLIGSMHAAYFLKSLSLIGEWQYGYGGYASTAQPVSVRVPFSGYYVSAGYFLTGEHVERRTRVKPLRPLVPVDKDDVRGIGAWELAARVSQLEVGNEIFSSGFADPNLWSNRATTTEVGLNWYLNEYTKISTFWLHGEFGSPVQYRPGQYQSAVDLFWMRCQLYF